MANAQVILDRIPTVNGKPFLRINVIDNGDGTVSLYVEERANSDGLSNAAAIVATGSKVVGSAAGTVSGDGTTNTLPKWTDGAASMLGDSRIIDDVPGDLITIDSQGGELDLGDVNFVGNQTVIIIDDSSRLVRMECLGEFQMGDPLSLGNHTVLRVNDSAQLITLGAANVQVTGVLGAAAYAAGAAAGVDGTFTSQDGKTITVTKGLITAIV